MKAINTEINRVDRAAATQGLKRQLIDKLGVQGYWEAAKAIAAVSLIVQQGKTRKLLMHLMQHFETAFTEVES